MLIEKKEIFNYSLLAVPLAFVGLPIYINISDFYARQFAIDLSVIAFLLLIVRAIDTIQDPLIGYFSDALIKKNFTHKKIILISSVFLSFSFFLLFNPPSFTSKGFVYIWFLIFLTATYTFFNFTLINFETIAILIAKNQQQRIAINSAKEFCGLVGVLLASASPSIIAFLSKSDVNQSYFYLSLMFVVMLFVILVLFFRKINSDNYKIYSQESNKNTNLNPKNSVVFDHSYSSRSKSKNPKHESIFGLIGFAVYDFAEVMKKIWQHKTFCKLIVIFFINSMAVSIPASVVIFYVSDVLHKREQLGAFLVVYFLSASLFIFMWKSLAEKFGKIKVWSFSIFGSIITFIFAYFVGEQNASMFYLICFCSGVFLGADLIMPPAIIADLIHDKKDKISSYVSLWNMSNKTALMLASSACLLILNYFGYQPSDTQSKGIEAIPFVYAILPCILKLIVIFSLTKMNKIQKI